MMYHVNNNGDVKRCRAKIQSCKFEIHGETVEKAQMIFEEKSGSTVITVTKTTVFPEDSKTLPKVVDISEVKDLPEIKEKALSEDFTNDSYFGMRSPREVQLEALNGVVKELQENDTTQLIAACGTGKTYMHRQLLRQAMSGEDSNGIGVMLTSSIRLANDTAADLRPTGGYDQSLGEYGKDYEVIEVHSSVGMKDGRQSVREKGVINVDRIYNQMKDALDQGKKIVIVSTYDSVNKVQEAQAKFENQDKASADLLIHDEAHNVLGQQKPTTVAADDNELSAYVGFHNDIPGSLQARKRLYSTATPIVRETESDKEPTGDLKSFIKSSKKMQDGDQYERITVYSDDPMVGKVSGFISQHEAIESKCLATPDYQIRESVLKGSLKDYSDPVVGIDGKLKEKGVDASETDLRPNTYGALVSTLDAMVADPEDGKNPANNVLAYVGSIDESEAFKKAFKQVALHEAHGMTPDEALSRVNSENPALKRQARMALLAANADDNVLAAHSRTDSKSVAQRKKAFEMFEGNAVQNTEWTPNKKVLANVNIFSEGVSISEIDTVVISDDDKLNEKAMTQAIGRAIRVLPGNDVKKYGHVIIPSIKDETGKEINSSSVNLAAYTATRVERGTTTSKLRGEKIKEDSSTSFKVYKADNTTEERLAKTYAQASITSPEDLAIAAEVSGNHTYLLNDETIPNYKDMPKNEQFELIKARTNDKLMRLTKESDSLQYFTKVQSHLAGKTSREVREISRNGRVVTNALANGDIGSINPRLAQQLIKNDVLTTAFKKVKKEVTLDEKREFLKKYPDVFALAIAIKSNSTGPEHAVARDMMVGAAKNDNKARLDAMRLLKNGSKETERSKELKSSFEESVKNDDFVKLAYAAVSDADGKKIPMFDWLPSRNSILESKKKLDDKAVERDHNDAVSGESEYSVSNDAIKKNGELSIQTLRKILSAD